ncbi:MULTISPECIES: hypothetical protein [Brevibacillus]|uniref:hypothetical protein n=1 Tax=Brevibacillus TaxID=55080 RepID=UPI0018CEFA5F|nr:MULTISPECIES: hypothetical protein [Brevibacillus]MBG9941956.1 hypothetical protein [Brevibacillus formosus]MBG9942825.1 hypothetical protein [Brevibacillus formosus]MBG9942847.1 hypothetical protein [Brevibacillus formosus]MBG9943944.1 hypothetical protein [Brevibacillus formosus]MCM3143880.1 hypothetical protein [Brevibacillus sp. MER 51]
MQKPELEETTTVLDQAFSLMVEQAKNGNNEALLKVLEEMQPEIDSLAGFLKLPKEEGIHEITTRFIEQIRG